MRSLRHLTFICATLAMTLASCDGAPQDDSMAAAAQQKGKPNILFILVDDLGAVDLGYTGSRFYETPNIDRLAAHSVSFVNAYAPSPVCSPTRAALMTGKDPARLGITTWIPGGEYQNMPLIEPVIPNALPLSERTVAEVLRDQGYSTFFAGKWHLGGKGYLPTDQGFDVNIGGGHEGKPPHGYYTPYGNAALPDGPPGEYLTDRLTDETLAFLAKAQDGDKPFFAYLSYYTVHTPIQAAPRGSLAHFTEKAARQAAGEGAAERAEGIGRTKLAQDNAAYASMIYALDENVGRLMKALEASGLSENTIVIFTSDNGGLSTLDPAISLYDEGTPTSNEPWRAGKGWTYEGGIRVPLLIAMPGHKPGRVEAPVMLTDLFATMADFAGAEEPRFDSISLAPALAGQPLDAARPLFWHFPHYHGSGSTPASALREGKWKLVRTYETDRWELFDLEADPEEKNDLAAAYPEQLKKMQAELARAERETNARLPIARHEE